MGDDPVSQTGSVCLFPDPSDDNHTAVKTQLFKLAVEGLISMNTKRKALWKSYFDLITENDAQNAVNKSPDAKKKRLASSDKLDSIMADLSLCQTEFWSHLQKFSHVLLNELKPQAIEVGKQLDEIRERRA